VPFRKPDASSGGAHTPEEARAHAERAAARSLVAIDARWAGAWVRVLRGEEPWPAPRPDRPPRAAVAPAPTGSRTWALGVLGLSPGATAAEIKRAFRGAALRTHPDRGGEDAAFIDVRRALDVALASAEARGRRPRRKV
jgi:DnaJ domain